MGLRKTLKRLRYRVAAAVNPVAHEPTGDTLVHLRDLPADASEALALPALARAAGIGNEPAERLLAARAAQFPDSRPRYWAVVNFEQHSRLKRLYLFDVVGRTVEQYLVAHGQRSESASRAGFAETFSNEQGSKCSSLGVYRCAETYYGKNGLSLRLDGLEETNSNARRREVVVHGADYVSVELAGAGRIGHSDGCAAVEFRYTHRLIRALKDGSLLLMWKRDAS